MAFHVIVIITICHGELEMRAKPSKQIVQSIIMTNDTTTRERHRNSANGSRLLVCCCDLAMVSPIHILRDHFTVARATIRLSRCHGSNPEMCKWIRRPNPTRYHNIHINKTKQPKTAMHTKLLILSKVSSDKTEILHKKYYHDKTTTVPFNSSNIHHYYLVSYQPDLNYRGGSYSEYSKTKSLGTLYKTFAVPWGYIPTFFLLW